MRSTTTFSFSRGKKRKSTPKMNRRKRKRFVTDGCSIMVCSLSLSTSILNTSSTSSMIKCVYVYI